MTNPVPSAPRRRDFPAWIYITTFFLIVLLAFAPIITTIIGVSIAGANGCQINEANVSPCVINGTDYGSTMQSLGMSFWFTLYSFPLAIVLFIVWLVIFIVHLVVAGRRRKAAA